MINDFRDHPLRCGSRVGCLIEKNRLLTLCPGRINPSVFNFNIQLGLVRRRKAAINERCRHQSNTRISSPSGPLCLAWLSGVSALFFEPTRSPPSQTEPEHWRTTIHRWRPFCLSGPISEQDKTAPPASRTYRLQFLMVREEVASISCTSTVSKPSHTIRIGESADRWRRAGPGRRGSTVDFSTLSWL